MSRSFVLVGALTFLTVAPLAAGVDHWTARGPEGGSIVRLAASPAAPGTVWGISPLDKVFKTTDGAATWTPVPSLQDRGITDIVPDPANASIVYARSFPERVLKSLNGGRSWSTANEGISTQIYTLAIAPSRPSTLYATSLEQLFKSTDGGSHWSAVSALHLPRSLVVSPADPDTLLVITGDFESLLLRSVDGGIHWTEVTGLSTQMPDTVTFDPHTSTVLYARTFREGLVRSDDAGETWTALDWPETSRSFFVQAMKIDPHSPGTLWLAGRAYGDPQTLEGLWRSDDRGAQWTLVYSDLPVRDIAVDPQAGLLVGVPKEGVLQSGDRGLDWSPAHRGLVAQVVNELAVAEDGTVWAGAIGDPSPFLSGQYNSLLRSRDGGVTWDDLRPAGLAGLHVSGIAPSPSSPETVHVAVYGGVFKTKDGGETWTLQNEGLRLGEALLGIAVAPSRPSTVYVAGIGSPICDESVDCVQSLVFRSNDGGAMWRRTGLQVPQFEAWGSLLVHPKSSGTVWIGGHGLYRSTDSGATWTRLGNGLRGFVLDLVLDPSAPDKLTAAVWSDGSRKVFQSRDGGGHWRPASSGLPPGELVWDLAVDPARPATVYAATEAGVFVTDTGGARWHSLGGPRAAPAYSVAVDPSDPRTVYAGTDAGLFVLTRTDR